MSRENLTERESHFIEDYIKTKFANKRASYMRAYRIKNADQASVEVHRLLKKDKIKKALEEQEGLAAELARENKLSRSHLLRELKDIIYGTTTHVDKQGKVWELRNKTKDVLSAIAIVCKMTGDFAPEKKMLKIEPEVQEGITPEELARKTPEELEKYKESILSSL